ncbi:MAG: lipopolysaccharide biosynthesis protein [Bradymonadales bacterium]|nr:lipopolysaccharide biosynthesis protein [Bradymonadales bacterium]
MTLENPQYHIKRGLFWLGSASAYTRAFSFASTLVVMWFLTREEMGLAAIAWSVSVFLEAFNGLGVGTSLIQTPHLARREKHTLFWFSTGLSLLLMAGIMLAAPLIARFYGNRLLTPMIMVSAAKLLFVGVALVPLQLLNRNLSFRAVGTIQAAATTLAALVNIVLAAAGAGAWAPVISNVSTGLVTLVGVYLAAPFWPRIEFAFADLKRHLLFGIRVATSGIIYHFYRNVDFFILGKMLGMEALGVYRVAFDLAMEPAQVIINVVNRVAYPVFARIADKTDQLLATFAQMTRFNVLLVGPLAVYISFVAYPLISVVTNDRWLVAAPALSVLCWAGLLRSLVQIFPQLYHAKGAPQLAIYDSLASLVVISGTIYLGLLLFGDSWGILAVCYAWLVSYPLLLAFQIYLARRVVPLDLGQYLRSQLPVFGGLGLVALLFWALSPLDRLGLGHLPYLLISAAAGLALYAAYLRIVLGIRLKDALPRKQVAS